MYPIGKEESLSKSVSEILDIVTKSGINYRFGPMGTVLEGDWDGVMQIVQRCYEKMKEKYNRIGCHISIDYREGRIDGLKKKVESVEDKLGIKLEK